MKILVIGAGVGGLAVARGLLAAGHRVQVYEQAPARPTGGAAVTIFSNGTAVLDDLGVSLDGVGARIDRLDALTARGRLRTSMNIAHAAGRFGFVTKTISRRRLLERLADGLPDDLIRYGAGCQRVTQDNGQVTATFSDGPPPGATCSSELTATTRLYGAACGATAPSSQRPSAPGRASARSTSISLAHTAVS
jgi:2-polyprenyl-6-methoxyphenol hydroxylase-like FAD-dependent oxidoreductase